MFDFNVEKKMNEDFELLKDYDTIIIGAGPAGLSAALYAKRKGLDVLLVSSDFGGGQLLNTKEIDNYLGFHDITGEKLTNEYLNHVNTFNIHTLFAKEVKSIKKLDNGDFFVDLLSEEEFNAKSIIIATGGLPRKLGVKGEDEFVGMGVSYCAICDGAFYHNRDVVVVGGGNSAVETAIDMAKIANKVTVIQIEDDFTADKVLVDQLKANDKIEYHLNSQVNEIVGSNMGVEKVLAFNNKENKAFEVETDGLFIEIGVIPNSNLVKDLVKLNPRGEIIVSTELETSVDGIYAVGDVTDFPFKQIIIAASHGATAALSASNYLNKKKGK